MPVDPEDQWASVAINESLAGRRPGGSPADESRELRRSSPMMTTLARLLHLREDERARRRGATGEQVSAWWLGRLPAGWHLFNDIPVADHGANVDHLIVGPAGVFTADAKNLTGKVWVASGAIRHNGHPTDYLPKARSEAQRASRLLSAAFGHGIHVRPVIAILADSWTIKEMPSDVYVGAPRGVKSWLLGQPVVLMPFQITTICAAAANPATWQG